MESEVDIDGAAIQGLPIAMDGLNPLAIDRTDTVWLVAVGHVDIFALPMRAGRPSGQRRHLLRVGPNQAFFPLPTSFAGLDGEIGFLAVGSPRTEVLAVERSRLHCLGTGRLAELAERWIVAVASAIAPSRSVWADRIVDTESPTSLAAGERLYGHPRRISWLTPQEGAIGLFDGEPVVQTGGPALPLAGPAWVESRNDISIEIETTEAIIARDEFWRAIDQFGALAAVRIARGMDDRAASDRNRLAARSEAAEQVGTTAYSRLAALLVRGHKPAPMDEGGASPLIAATRLVGEALGVQISVPGTESGTPDIAAIAASSRLCFRWVVLGEGWWRRDHGALLAFRGEQARPVALLPSSPRRYDMAEPGNGRRTVDAELGSEIGREAVMFYRPLPGQAVSVPGLVRFGLRGVATDMATLLLSGLAVALLGLVTPVLTETLFGSVIPDTERGRLVQLALGLVAVALGGIAFQAAQAIALLRFEGRLDWQIQSALFERLLSLPAPFFRRFTTGDLTDRVLGLQTIRTMLTGALLTALLSGAFGLISFALLVYYSARLALVAGGLVVLSFAATTGFSYARLRHERIRTERQGRVDGLVVQFLIGIAKLRVAASEIRAFAIWSKLFATQKDSQLKGRLYANRLTVFDSAFPVFATLILFAVAATIFAEPPQQAMPGAGPATPLDIGRFLAFNAAFGQLLAAVTGLASALTSALGAVPLFERSAPILSTAGESAGGSDPPGQLRGEIELSRVTFRYNADAPPALDGLSLRVEPGSFVAVVGPSGSGKSTLFRLLLGFEAPESGGVFYDGRSLASLDRAAVRRQIGVVLQNGRITAGSVFSNIVGSAKLTESEAWSAAKLAGLDADIEAMPMGLHTVLSEGGGTLSGGQRQRLMVARALVRKPSILLFDEATSALDNRTQAIVTESLMALNTTRIVIAHRLSTIRNVERIFVVDRGRIVQQGRFAELMVEPGPFAALASRQMV